MVGLCYEKLGTVKHVGQLRQAAEKIDDEIYTWKAGLKNTFLEKNKNTKESISECNVK